MVNADTTLSRRAVLQLAGAGAVTVATAAAWLPEAGAAATVTALTLSNPGFEEAGTGIPGWEPVTGADAFSITTEVAAEGGQALRVSATGAARLRSSSVQVTPGQYYAVLVQGWWTAGAPELTLRFLDADGAEVAARDRSHAGLKADQWYWLSVAGHAPEGAATAYVTIGAAAAATFVADDVRLVETAPKVETFAYAVEEIAVTGMTRHDDRHYVVTRNQTPAQLGEYDRGTGELTGQWELSEGIGAWTPVATEEAIFLATFTGGAIHRLDLGTREVSTVGHFTEDDVTVYGMVMAADGNLYCVTYPDCALWRVDPATGAGERVAELGEGELYGRGIATEGNDIVVCTTSPGGVYHYDISSGALTDITPGDRSAFIAVGIRDGKVWATYGPRVVEFTLAGEVLRRWQLAGSQIDTMGVLEDGSVAVWMRPTGHVHRLAPDAEEFEDLGTPAAEQEGRALILEADGRLGGLAGNGLLWSWSEAGFDTDDLNLSDLVGPTVVQHLCVMPNGMVATSGTDVHIHRRPRSGERAVRVPFAGTPMRLAYGDGALWAATYPRTEVYRIQPGTWLTERIGAIGNGQYRPYAMHYDEGRNAMVIATEPSSIPAGGAVTVVDLASHEFTSWVAPLGGQAVIHATAGERTFLSGGLSDEPPLVGEIDLDTGEVAWTVAPLPHLRTIESTVLHEGLLYGVARGNEWFAIDVDSHQVVHTGWLSGTHSYGNVAVQQGRVVLPTHRSLVFELDVNNRDAQVLAEGGEESWRRPPQFGFDRRGTGAWGLSDLRLARWDLSGDHLPQ